MPVWCNGVADGRICADCACAAAGEESRPDKRRRTDALTAAPRCDGCGAGDSTTWWLGDTGEATYEDCMTRSPADEAPSDQRGEPSDEQHNESGQWH